jgi:pre-mRNA-splicing factor ATP-dependent RNA helicase DHX15/PRP43
MKKARVDLGEADASGGAAASDPAFVPPGAVNPLTGRPFSARYRSILAKRVQLPVYLQRDDFVKMLHTHQSIVLVGETGSGKTTQARKSCKSIQLLVFTR